MPLFADAAADVPDEDRPASRPAPHRAGTGGHLNRLQAYTAEPSDVPAQEVPHVPTSAEVLGGHAQAAPGVPGAFSGPGMNVLQRAAALDEVNYQKLSAAQTAAQSEEQARTYAPRTTKELSWDKYLELSDRERAAVDFNTMLVQAREKDLNRQDAYKPNDAQREVYDRTVKRLFGDTGVSETYAPETLALLNDVGFSGSDAKRFDDIDDFLGLSAALTSKDLDKLTNGKNAKAMEISRDILDTVGAPLGITAPDPATGAATMSTLASGTRDLTEQLTRGNQILENLRRVTAGARAESVGFYGGLPPERFAAPQVRLEGDDEIDFPKAYEAVANTANDPSIFEGIKNFLKGDRLKRFLQYADTRSAYSMDHQMGLGTNNEVQYRSPEEFRKILGLRGGETGAPAAR